MLEGQKHNGHFLSHLFRCRISRLLLLFFLFFFVIVWFLNKAKSSVKGSCYCCFRSESFSYVFLVQFFCILFVFFLFVCFFFIIIVTVKDTNNMWPLWSNVIYAIKKKTTTTHVYWGCDIAEDPERLFRLCNQSTMCKCSHFFSLKEERCLYRVNLCALKEMRFFKV